MYRNNYEVVTLDNKKNMSNKRTREEESESSRKKIHKYLDSGKLYNNSVYSRPIYTESIYNLLNKVGGNTIIYIRENRNRSNYGDMYCS